MPTVFRFLWFVAVPVRTASDQPYRLQKFKLRLCYASDIRQPNLEVVFLLMLCLVSEKTMGNERNLRFPQLSSMRGF